MSLRTIFAALAISFALNGPAHAVAVNPGDFAFLPGTTAAANPELAGTVANDNLIAFDKFITAFQTIGGNVQNRVVESDDLGTLIFAPRIRDTYNIATVSYQITGFQLDGYAGWSTDINFRTDGLGDKGPSHVVRSVDGDTLTFAYTDPLHIDGIAPGLQEESLFPSILTDATSFSETGSMIIFGFLNEDPTEAFSIVIDGLAVPVPLPAPFALLAGGLAMLALRRKSA